MPSGRRCQHDGCPSSRSRSVFRFLFLRQEKVEMTTQRQRPNTTSEDLNDLNVYPPPLPARSTSKLRAVRTGVDLIQSRNIQVKSSHSIPMRRWRSHWHPPNRMATFTSFFFWCLLFHSTISSLLSLSYCYHVYHMRTCVCLDVLTIHSNDEQATTLHETSAGEICACRGTLSSITVCFFPISSQ